MSISFSLAEEIKMTSEQFDALRDMIHAMIMRSVVMNNHGSYSTQAKAQCEKTQEMIDKAKGELVNEF